MINLPTWFIEALSNFIIDPLREIFDQYQAIGVILYGSNINFCSPYRDIDLFVISEKSGQDIRIIHWPFDVVILSHQEAIKRASLLDPLVTEPLLTGRILWGENTIHIGQAIDTIAASNFLIEKSYEMYCSLRELRKLQTIKERFMIDNLSFVLSYLLFALYYHQSPVKGLVTFSDLQKLYPNSPVFHLRKMKYKSAIDNIFIDKIFKKLDILFSLNRPSFLKKARWVLG